jgi:hypothetical protein
MLPNRVTSHIAKGTLRLMRNVYRIVGLAISAASRITARGASERAAPAPVV